MDYNIYIEERLRDLVAELHELRKEVSRLNNQMGGVQAYVKIGGGLAGLVAGGMVTLLISAFGSCA